MPECAAVNAPGLILPEQVIRPASRRVAWLLVAALTVLIVGSSTGAYLAYGDRVYFRQWTSVRTWQRPKDDIDLRVEGGLDNRRYQWYAAMHRSAQRSIRMRTHSDYTLGMVLVVLPRKDTTRDSISSAKGGHAWYMTDTVRPREIVVETTQVRVGDETFGDDQGRLVLIDRDGKCSQHGFATDAQSSAQMQAAVEEFLAAHLED